MVTRKSSRCVRLTVANVSSPTFRLTGCISIQDGHDRNYFLARVRQAYPEAARHVGTQHALRNAASYGAQEIVLVGHGRPGVLFTANADEPQGPDDYIDWRSDLSALKGVRVLRLIGCRTGAGSEGARLLNSIARAIHATVMAPTGDVYFGRPAAAGNVGLYLESQTRWQAATPDRPARSSSGP
jgi:hypothetical protein